jgi:Tfp pilus assembly protein PilZ
MRQLKVDFEAGRDLFEVYWNFLQSGGVVVRAGDGVVEGDELEVLLSIRSLKKSWRMRGRVARMAKDGRCFVAFDAGQSQEDLVNGAWADAYAVPERRHRRVHLRTNVGYRVGGGGAELRQAVLTNLSRGGCCIETDERLPVGTRVQLCGPGLAAVAKVRWVRRAPSRELGLEFASLIELGA